MSNVLQEAQQLINQGKKKTAAEKLKGYIEDHPHDHRPWVLLASIASDKFRAHCIQKANHLAKLAKSEARDTPIEEQPTVPTRRQTESPQQPRTPTKRPSPPTEAAQPVRMEASAIPLNANLVPTAPASSKGTKKLSPPTQPPVRAQSKPVRKPMGQNQRLKSLAKESRQPHATSLPDPQLASGKKNKVSQAEPSRVSPAAAGRTNRGPFWAALLVVGLLAAAGGLFLLQGNPLTSLQAEAETLPQEIASSGDTGADLAASVAAVEVSADLPSQEGITAQTESDVDAPADSPVSDNTTGAVGNLQEIDFEAEAAELDEGVEKEADEEIAADAAEAAIEQVATETPVPTASPTPQRIQPKEIAAVSEPRGVWTPTPLPTNTPEPTPTIVPTFAASSYDPDVWPVVGENERWVDVNLTTQTLIAYEGKEQVMVSVISSGRAPYYTVTGQFRVYLRYPTQTMDGRRLGFDYVTPGVPHVQYFYKDFALHGAFWHNDFGTPVSHGCVNLPLQDAEWLYNWLDYGSLVNVHY